MKKQYIYPQNMSAAAVLWLWSMRDFIIMVVAVLVGAMAWAATGSMVLLAAAGVFALLTIRSNDTTVLDFIKYSARFFIMSQQEFKWGLKSDNAGKGANSNVKKEQTK